MSKEFEEFNHSIPIIYSHLEGQYPFLLSNEKYLFRILFTSFNYHYITGELPKKEEDLLSEMRQYIKNENKDEFILFSPSEEWDTYLSKLFTYIGGVIDLRYSFKLDIDRFKNKFNKYIPKHNTKVELIKEGLSKKPFYQATIKENDKIICYCKAYMTGKKQAEIDVWTNVKYRYQGLAYETSSMLINTLLENNIIPNWNTWEAKTSSHNLAYKLGFDLEKKVKAFIWVSDFGKF